jgi:hypothetical protein
MFDHETINCKRDYHKERVEEVEQKQTPTTAQKLPPLKENLKQKEEEFSEITVLNKNHMRQIVDSRTTTYNGVVEQFIGNMMQVSAKLSTIVDGVSPIAKY